MERSITQNIPIHCRFEYFILIQDGVNENRPGTIKLVEIDEVVPIDIDQDIIGKTVYTSNNDVTFTNGLKIEFNSDVSFRKLCRQRILC